MTAGAITEQIGSGRAHTVWLALGPILASIAYFLGAEGAFAIGTLTQQFAPFWPPNVVLLCALLLTPVRQWPLYIAATFPAHVLAEWGVAMPMPQLLMAFGCNVSIALLNAITLKSVLKGPPWLGSLRSAGLYLLLVALMIPAVVALAAGFEPILGDGDPKDYWLFWGRWYLSNALGALTLTPVFLTTFGDGGSRARQKPSRARLLEAVLLSLALLAACSAAFDTQLTGYGAGLVPAVLYLPVPILIAAAVRFGAKGASGAVLVVTIMVLFGVMHGHGPFAGGTSRHDVLSVQLFLAVVAIPTILVAALIEELQRANERLSAVLDGISDCHFTVDRAGRITAVNSNAATWSGAPRPAELIGQSYRKITRETSEQPDLVERTIVTGHAVHGEVANPDGRLIDLHVYPAAGGASVFFHDITGHRAAERTARKTQELLQSSLDALTAQIAILDRSGKIVATNAAWQQAVEALNEAGECYLLGANFLEECERARPHQRKIADGLKKVIAGQAREFRFEYPSDFIEGTWYQMRGTSFGTGAELRIVLANENITEVKASEGALRRLTGKLLRSQDEARRQIARELHDSTAQNLLAATLGIGQALRLTPRLKQTAKAALEESRELIEQSQHEIRTVSYLLHPPMLDEAGLPAALRWFCAGFAKRTEIAVELDVDPDLERLPAELERTLFRVAQEGLTNVHRHSGSTRVRVGLKLETSAAGSWLNMLSIVDNGKGMPPGETEAINMSSAQSVGIGLAGMRERLHQFGGRLEIHSGPDGTALHAAVPIRPETAATMRPKSGEISA
jgi:signal transduction histidine kinase